MDVEVENTGAKLPATLIGWFGMCGASGASSLHVASDTDHADNGPVTDVCVNTGANFFKDSADVY